IRIIFVPTSRKARRYPTEKEARWVLAALSALLPRAAAPAGRGAPARRREHQPLSGRRRRRAPVRRSLGYPSQPEQPFGSRAYAKVQAEKRTVRTVRRRDR